MIQGLLLLFSYTLCKPLEVLCRMRISEYGSLQFRIYPIQLLPFGFNPSQLLLLVVVFLDFVGMLPSPVACVLQHSLSVLAVVFMVVQRSLFPSLFLLPSAILLYLFWVRPSVFSVILHQLLTVQHVVSVSTLTLALLEFLVREFLPLSHCIP